MLRLRKILAANMKTYRSEVGFSQTQLAEKAGAAVNCIVMIESGKRFPAAAVLECIADVLGKDLLDLFSLKPVRQDREKHFRADIKKLIAARLKLLNETSRFFDADS